MIERGDRLIVAVSGGADSVALLRALVILSSEYRLHLTTAHLNHGLRGQESDNEEEFVRGLCTGMGVHCICKKIDAAAVRRGKGRSLEEVCRDERYQFLKETAQVCSAGKIATGHHRDDQAETVLMNLIRGSGLEGLKGIDPIRDDRIIRPLLHVTKEEIITFLNRERLTYMIDSSNLSSLFLRNRIRNSLIPELTTRYNPRIVAGLSNMAEAIRREDDFLKKTVREILCKWEIDAERKEIRIPIDSFLGVHEAIRARIIKQLLEAGTPSGSGIGYRHIEAVLELFQSSQRNALSLDLPYNISVVKRDKVLWIKKADQRTRRSVHQKEKIAKLTYSYPIHVPGEVYLNEIGKNIRFELVERPQLSEMMGLPAVGFLDYERISPPLVVRNHEPGDRIELLGMARTKKLKSYFIDRKIPYQNRIRIPLLVDARSVLWIAGERISDRAKVTEQTKRVLRAEMV